LLLGYARDQGCDHPWAVRGGELQTFAAAAAERQETVARAGDGSDVVVAGIAARAGTPGGACLLAAL
jgi:hypothetical protein